MADDPTIDNPTNGDIKVSADEIPGSPPKYAQRVKLAYSADGVDTHVPADELGILSHMQNRSISTSGSITASAQNVALDVTNMAALVVQVGGTYAGVNITFEALANNGSTWVAIAGVRSDAPTVETTSGVLGSTARAWEFDVAGYTDFRVRSTAWTSGTMTVAINTSAATSAPFIVAQLAAGTNAVGSVTATGSVAQDGVMSGTPVAIAKRASQATPTQMSADGDVVYPWADRSGADMVRSRPAATGTLTNVSGSASSVTLLAANTARLGATIVNDSTATLYVKLGTSAAANSYTYRLDPGATLELPGVPAIYTGIITGIWTSAAGNARVTEVTA